SRPPAICRRHRPARATISGRRGATVPCGQSSWQASLALPIQAPPESMLRSCGRTGPIAAVEATVWSGRRERDSPFHLLLGGDARSLRDEADRRLNRRLDRPRDDIGEIAFDADLRRQEPIDEPLIGVDIRRDDLEQIVDAAAGRPAAHDVVGLAYRPLEALEIFIAVLLEDDL